MIVHIKNEEPFQIWVCLTAPAPVTMTPDNSLFTMQTPFQGKPTSSLFQKVTILAPVLSGNSRPLLVVV